MQLTDREMIDSCLKGDQSAFPQIVRRYADTVLGFLKKISDNHQADDLFQETFSRVYVHLHSFKGDNLRPWLFKIAANVALSERRRRRNIRLVRLGSGICEDGCSCPGLGIEIAADSTDQPVNRAMKNERAIKVRQAIETLPPRQRAILVLSYYERLSCSDVAKALDCSVGTVKKQLFRALNSLEPKLAGLGD